MSEDITTIPVAADAEDDDEAEVAAMGTIAKALKPLTPSTRRRVIEWAAGKYGASTGPQAAATADTATRQRGRSTSGTAAKPTTASAKGGARRKAGSLSLDKSLNFHPKGVESFADFAAAKAPKSTYEQNVVAVYWLTRIAGQDAATVDQVYSAYKDRSWRVPANLRNNLAVTSSTKGWVDSASMESLKVTVGGENFVEHDLPSKPKGKA